MRISCAAKTARCAWRGRWSTASSGSFRTAALIAFSVGHKYKTSNPNDRGAALVGGGTEAEFAEKVLRKAEEMLHGVTGPEEGRHLRVVKGEATLLDEIIDEDAQMVWDPERCLLRIVG